MPEHGDAPVAAAGLVAVFVRLHFPRGHRRTDAASPFQGTEYISSGRGQASGSPASCDRGRVVVINGSNTMHSTPATHSIESNAG